MPRLSVLSVRASYRAQCPGGEHNSLILAEDAVLSGMAAMRREIAL
jgi:hypothetical protein